MPLIIVLGILSTFGIISYVKDGGTPSKAHTPEEIERMSKEMTGKSKKSAERLSGNIANRGIGGSVSGFCA